MRSASKSWSAKSKNCGGLTQFSRRLALFLRISKREVRYRFAAEERVAEDSLGVGLIFHPGIELGAQLGEAGSVAGWDSIRLRCGSKSCPQKLNVLVSTKARGSLAALLTNTPSGFARW